MPISTFPNLEKNWSWQYRCKTTIKTCYTRSPSDPPPHEFFLEKSRNRDADDGGTFIVLLASLAKKVDMTATYFLGCPRKLILSITFPREILNIFFVFQEEILAKGESEDGKDSTPSLTWSAIGKSIELRMIAYKKMERQKICEV